MPIFKKRNRIVSFRVSEEEFQILQQVSESQGAHSISDYARLASCRGIPGADPDDPLVLHLESLETRVQQLCTQVARLDRLVG